ncbi:V-type proton ATPase subunit S1-like [Chamaea fasciata]|uniref:V-type proton ATPase subunit S1-like n=1 Tax=Chamaea fasciata TaxID=190680 RepID=UPI00336A92B3
MAAAAGGTPKMAAALWALLAAVAGIAPGPPPAAAAHVPLLVWSTERSLWTPQTLSGGSVLSEPELQQLLEPGLRGGPQDGAALPAGPAVPGGFRPRRP